jgi:phi LC3 family holin
VKEEDMINWKVRLGDKLFWLTGIPLVLLLVQQVCAVFGVNMDFGVLQEQLVAIVGTVFAILALVGVVRDPTTVGVGDSKRAMGYERPYSVTGEHAEVRDEKVA